MDVLVCLAERAGEVVSRETLNEQVWGNLVVTDQAVTNCISELRHHLGDDRAAHRVIETIPKRGYRLAGAGGTCAAPAQPLPPIDGNTSAVADGLMLLGIALLAIALLGGAGAWRSDVGADAHQRGRAALRERGRR